MSAPMLAIKDVTAGYGNIPVLHGVSLDISKGEIVTLIGANGAGKTTLMMTICGRPRAARGNVLFEGEDITELPTHRIARLCIAQSPEGRRIFPRLTVLENLQMGALIANDPNGFDKDLDRVCALFPVLKQRKGQRGGTLSGGEQQMLAIARALMGRPKLLLLDEPSLGLAPLIVQRIGETLREINAAGTSILLVEQNTALALSISDHAYVLEHGRVERSGPSQELRQDASIAALYLGGSASEHVTLST